MNIWTVKIAKKDWLNNSQIQNAVRQKFQSRKIEIHNLFGDAFGSTIRRLFARRFALHFLVTQCNIIGLCIQICLPNTQKKWSKSYASPKIWRKKSSSNHFNNAIASGKFYQKNTKKCILFWNGLNWILNLYQRYKIGCL